MKKWVELALTTAFEEIEREKQLDMVRLKRSTGLRRCPIFETYDPRDAETMYHLSLELGVAMDEIKAWQCEVRAESRKRAMGFEACEEMISLLRRRYTWNERIILEDRCNKTLSWPKLGEKLRQKEPLLKIRYGRLLDDLWETQKKLIATIIFFYYRMDIIAP